MQPYTCTTYENLANLQNWRYEPFRFTRDLRRKILQVQHEDAIRRLCFSPHQPSLLACASDDTTITVLDLSTRSTMYSIINSFFFLSPPLSFTVDL